jgi:polyisoprenoid-binding protein YceI
MTCLKTLAFVLPIAFFAACADPSENVPAANVSSTNQTTAAAADTTRTASTTPPAASKLYVINPENSKVDFTGSKVTGKHDGGFKKFQGEVSVSGQTVSSAKVTIDTTSLWSDNDRLTTHLKGPDFFDVTKYPTAEFASTSISGQGANSTVTGNLTLHGITKQISFPAKIEIKDDVVTVAAEFSINRFDFDMKFAGKADDLIREGVVLKLDVKATPKQG